MTNRRTPVLSCLLAMGVLILGLTLGMTCKKKNQPPGVPSIPSGPTSGRKGEFRGHITYLESISASFQAIASSVFGTLAARRSGTRAETPRFEARNSKSERSEWLSGPVPQSGVERPVEHLPEHLVEHLPENLPESLVERLPEHLPEHLVEHLPEHLPEHLVEHLPEHLPEHLVEHLPEHLLEHLVEHLPGRCLQNRFDR